MKKSLLLAAGAVALGLAGYLAFAPADAPEQAGKPAKGAAIVQVQVPDNLSENAKIGQRAFDVKCATCHGLNGSGVEGFGPPLVHVIYEPSHHGDMAFVMAVQRGVQSHHWRFGNMPPQPGLTQADVIAITTYVRELQRANGIN